MKFCPQCTSGYHDRYETCPKHHGLLNEIRDLRQGMVIRDTYRIVRKLGEGGMGAVYLAHHDLMNEPRALKFLSASLSRDAAFTNRFLREVRTLRQVRSKNVVDCGDLDRAEDDSLFFPMEFVAGPTLYTFMRRAPKHFDIPLALWIAEGIAEGLAAAHAKGMVHRDIKPENILMGRLDGEWVPKIADFGIVATKEGSARNTITGGTLLTMAYAAPEQWRGTPAAQLDGRTDLYALGGVLFEMLTGQTPFAAESYEGWAEQHRNAAPVAPSSLRPELADWNGLDALVLRLLAKNYDDRPSKVAEVITQLRAIRLSRPELPVDQTEWPAETEALEISEPDLTLRQTALDRLSHGQEQLPSGGHDLTTVDPAAAARLSGKGPAGGVLGLGGSGSFGGEDEPRESKARWLFWTVPIVVVLGVAAFVLWPRSATSSAPTTSAPTTPSLPTAALTVFCDVPCNWKLDEVAQTRIGTRGSTRVPIPAGTSVNVEAQPAEGRLPAKTQTVSAEPGRAYQARFAFRQDLAAARTRAASLMQQGHQDDVDGELPKAYLAYSEAQRVSPDSDKAAEAAQKSQKVLEECKTDGISCQ